MSVFKDGLLAGKVAFVTGGGSGINQTIAELYAAQGAAVALVGRTQEKLDAVAAGIVAQGGRAVGFSADVRDMAALESAATRAAETFGGIDLVIAGAAGNFAAPAAAISANGFKSVVDIDLLGTFNTAKAVFPHLRTPGASILAITATQAFVPTPLQAHVCAAKAGIEMLVKTLAMEWGEAGIRVNALAPGPVDDTEGMRRLSPTAEAKAKICATIPLGRYASREEIAGLALFLASPAAAYVTGATFVADGGQSLGGSKGLVDALMG